jgi:glycerol kinase
MAGLEIGIFQDIEHLQTLNTDQRTITPGPERNTVYKTYQEWENALKGLF